MTHAMGTPMTGKTENPQKHSEARAAASGPPPEDLGPNAQQVVTSLLSQQEELLGELRTAHDQVDQVRQGETAVLREEIAKLRTAAEERDSAVAESRAAAEAAASAATEAHSRTEVTIQQLDDIRADHQELSPAVVEFRAAAEEARAAAENAGAQAASGGEQIQALQSTVEELTGSVEAATAVFEEDHAELAGLKERLAAAEGRLETLEDLQEQESEETRETPDEDPRFGDLSHRIDELTAAGETFSAQNERIEQLDSNLAETLQRLTEISGRIRERDELIAGLTEQAEEKDARLAELNQRVVELETEGAAHRSDAESAEAARPQPEWGKDSPSRQRLTPVVENSSAVARFAGRKVKGAASRALRRR